MRPFYLLFLIVTFSFSINILHSQSTITGVYSDFGGYWYSALGNISSTHPDNSHNLIGFKVGATVFSTGVADPILTSNGVVFNPQVFEAMPTTVTGNVGFFGVGTNYGGWCNVAPVPITNNKSALLIDGIQGLNLGTAIFNTSSNSYYTVSSMTSSSIGDGIPDIIVTQMGAPSVTMDIFRFQDAMNVTVGNPISVNFTTIPSIAICQWKFYDSNAQFVNGAPNTVNCVNSVRDLRMIAFDFADFGITPLNYSTIAKLTHQLSGTSDQAFVAYNKTSIILLPITLSRFNAEKKGREVRIDWETSSEQNNDYFTIQRSLNGTDWESIAEIQGVGFSSNSHSYEYFDKYPYSGTSYYRLRQTDFDGNRSYSNIIPITIEKGDLSIYPNPATDNLVIEGENIENMRIFNTLGQDVTDELTILYKDSKSIHLFVGNLTTGIYVIKIESLVYRIQIR